MKNNKNTDYTCDKRLCKIKKKSRIMDITEKVEEIKDEDMMDEDAADDDSSEESSGDEVSDDEDVVKDKTEKGQAHHIRSRFLSLRIVFTKLSSFCFSTRFEIKLR